MMTRHDHGTAQRLVRCLVVHALALPILGCATLVDNGRQRVMLSRVPAAAPVAPSPGAPRVHVTVAPGSPLPAVEMREVVGWDLMQHTHPTSLATQPRGAVSTAGPFGGDDEEKADAVGHRVCVVPCARIVDGRRGQAFFFSGPGVSGSEHFTLKDASGEVQYTVSPGRASLQHVGIPLASAGAAGALVGAILLGVAAASGGDYKSGGAVLGVSAPMLGVGIALVFAGRTTFTVSPLPALTPVAPH